MLKAFRPCTKSNFLWTFSRSAGANFENAIVTDVLMDRSVIVDANLRNANFERTVRDVFLFIAMCSA